MANRETYPAAQSPLQGDVSGAAGATTVMVTGLQGNPISPATPSDQADLKWSAENGEWMPIVPSFTMSISDASGGLTILSDDWEIYVNGVGLEALANWPYGFSHQVFLNGVGVTGSEQ
jgi:hypothetical protein